MWGLFKLSCEQPLILFMMLTTHLKAFTPRMVQTSAERLSELLPAQHHVSHECAAGWCGYLRGRPDAQRPRASNIWSLSGASHPAQTQR